MARLYEQGTHRIEIVVRKDSSGGTQNNKTVDVENSGGGRQTTWRTTAFGSESSTRQKRIIATNTTHLLSVLKQGVGLFVQYKINELSYINGDEAYSDRINRNIEQITDFTNTASNVARGMVFGAWGGPVGIIMGGLLGGLTSAFSLASKYETRELNYSFKVFKENNAIEYKRARANLNLTTGRLR